MTKKKSLDEETCALIEEFYKKALKAAILSYEDCMQETVASKVADKCKATKLAIDHVKILTELAELAGVEGGRDSEDELAALLAQASVELDKYNLETNLETNLEMRAEAGHE